MAGTFPTSANLDAFIALVKIPSIQTLLRQNILLTKYTTTTSALTNKISLDNLMLLVENIITPQFLNKFNAGYTKLTDDLNAGTMDVAMYGITTKMLKYDFKNIFSNINVPGLDLTAYKSAVNAIHNYMKPDGPGVSEATATELANFMPTIFNWSAYSDAGPAIAKLFYYYHLTKDAYHCPIAIMAADPYLGFLTAEFTWTHNTKGIKFIADAAGAGSTNYTDTNLAIMNDIIAQSNAATLPETKLPEIARKAIGARIAAIPTEFAAVEDTPYKVPYENRLITTTGCVLDQLIYITELFNKNGKKGYTFSADEAALLKALADRYLTFSITLT